MWQILYANWASIDRTKPEWCNTFLSICLKGTFLHTSSTSFTFHSCVFAFHIYPANLFPLSFYFLITVLFLLVLLLVTVISAFSSVPKGICSTLILHLLPLFNHQFLHGGNEIKIIFNTHKCVTDKLCFFLTHHTLHVFLYMQEIYWLLTSKISSSSKGLRKGEGRMGELIHSKRISVYKCWVCHGNQRVGGLKNLITLCEQISSWIKLCISRSHQHVYKKW